MKLIILFTAMVTASAVFAQTPQKKEAATVRVQDAYNSDFELDTINHQKSDNKGIIGLNEEIIVRVKNFKTLQDEANPSAGPKKDIKLFLNGIQIDDIDFKIGKQSGDLTKLWFTLDRTDKNDKIWSQLLGAPGDLKTLFHFQMPVSVGLDKSAPQDSQAIITFRRINSFWFATCLGIIALYFIVLIRYARKSSLLRDSVVDLSPLNLPALNPNEGQYSLGKIQMAFWFSIVVCSFLFIWAITGNYELITSGILGLIGISAGTAIGAVSIDSNKAQATITRILALQKDEGTLIADIQALQAINPSDAVTSANIRFKQNAQDQVKANINQLLKGLRTGNKSFLSDILDDANGPSFHRLQMATWTIVLGLVFIYSVWADLTMPSFSTTQLTLLGITSGTYLGFKFPEKQG
jgi:hypothetical protein